MPTPSTHRWIPGGIAPAIATLLLSSLVSAAAAPAAAPSASAAAAVTPPATAAPDKPASKSVSTLDKVLAAHKVSVGCGYTTPPMNFLDADGNQTGFDIDLARAVVAKLGKDHGPLEIELVKVDTTSRITFLAAGRIDMTVSSLSHTRSREEAVDYAEPPYLWVGKQFYAKVGRFKSVKDLIGQRIAVQQGSNAFTAGAQFLKEQGDPDPKMMGFRTDGEALLALRQGKVEAFTQDNVIIGALLQGEANQYEPIGPIYSPGLYGIGVGPNDSRWRDAVSFALQDTMKDGTYEQIYQKWLGPKGKFPLATNARPRLPEDAYGPGQLMIWPD